MERCVPEELTSENRVRTCAPTDGRDGDDL